MRKTDHKVRYKKRGILAAGLLVVICLALSACGNAAVDNGETNQSAEGNRSTETSREDSRPDELPTGELPTGELPTDELPSNDGEAQEKDIQQENTVHVASAVAGKRVAFCGDSISTFTGYIPDNYSKFYPENGTIKDVNDTWWMQVIKRTGMEIGRNASYSGSTVSGLSQDDNDGRFSCGNKRIADLTSAEGEVPEVIIVLMGANDLSNNIPLGTYDGSSEVPEGNIETFSEAYALMLDKMKAWYPEAEIYCCTMTEVSRWNDEGEKFPFMNAQGLTAKDYNMWIKTVAQAKGVAVIDVYDCGITFENAQEYTSDGTHPNAAGAKLIADKVCSFFGV